MKIPSSRQRQHHRKRDRLHMTQAFPKLFCRMNGIKSSDKSSRLREIKIIASVTSTPQISGMTIAEVAEHLSRGR